MGNFKIPDCNSNKDAIILLQQVKYDMQRLLVDFCPHYTKPLSIISAVQMYLDPTFDVNNFEEYKGLHDKKSD